MSQYLTQLFGLHTRTALVTGASSGIGLAIAQALGRAGASVVLLARDRVKLDAAAAGLRAEGVETAVVSADLADTTALAGVVDEAANAFSEPDILVTAAGVNPRPTMEDISQRQWDDCMRLNVEAPFWLGQRCGPPMARRGFGRIINIGSQQSFRAFGNSGAYGVSKSAVLGLTRSQAEAWSQAGVCCNAIVPGFVRTPMTEETFAMAGRPEALAARTMVGRNGVGDDFAGVAVFLASEAGNFITGQAVSVDGGFSAT